MGYWKILTGLNSLQRNKTNKIYLIILNNKIYRNWRFESKNPSSGIECTNIFKAI